MTFTVAIVIILALGSIIGAIMVLKKSAKKFDLSQEQLDKIKQRNQALDQKEADEDK